MQAAGQLRTPIRYSRDRSVVPAAILMGLAVIVGLFLLLFIGGAFEAYPFLYLLPWISGLAIVMAIPSIVLHYQGKFSFADPIVFATISYFFPAFVIGGIFFAGGWSQPYFIALIQDADYTLPLTIFLVGLGFSGLAAGYVLPISPKLGAYISRRLPVADYSDSALILPGVILLVLGVMNTVVAFALGVFGFQRADEITSYEGLIYLTTLFWMQASFMLWFIIFRRKKLTVVFVPVIALLVGTSISKVLFAGNRGAIIQIFSIIALAYILSGRRFRLKQSLIAGVVLTVAMIGGMIYGTTFRAVKGSEAKQSADQYADNILRTFDQVGRSDMYESLTFGFASLAERVDIVSTLAVVVSNYEQLKPYEEAYGLDNNIWIDSTTFFIPRVVWKEKPAASDPRKYSDLYFNFGETSFAITPVGDLLRNFGIIGVPIGMFILGLCLRLIYSALVEGQPGVVWRLTMYFMLLTSVSYEGFYGTIIPHFFKVAVTAMVGVLIVSFLAKHLDRSGRGIQKV